MPTRGGIQIQHFGGRTASAGVTSRALLGGCWDYGARCGSRLRVWNNGAWNFNANVALRGVSDTVIIAATGLRHDYHRLTPALVRGAEPATNLLNLRHGSTSSGSERRPVDHAAAVRLRLFLQE